MDKAGCVQVVKQLLLPSICNITGEQCGHEARRHKVVAGVEDGLGNAC